MLQKISRFTAQSGKINILIHVNYFMAERALLFIPNTTAPH